MEFRVVAVMVWAVAVTTRVKEEFATPEDGVLVKRALKPALVFLVGALLAYALLSVLQRFRWPSAFSISARASARLPLAMCCV